MPMSNAVDGFWARTPKKLNEAELTCPEKTPNSSQFEGKRMLRITVHDDPESLTFQLEGRLADTLVHELEDCIRRTLVANPRSSVCIDLKDVTYVDATGKAFLAAVHAQGVELVASGCLMRAIVAELTSALIPKISKQHRSDW